MGRVGRNGKTEYLLKWLASAMRTTLGSQGTIWTVRILSTSSKGLERKRAAVGGRGTTSASLEHWTLPPTKSPRKLVTRGREGLSDVSTPRELSALPTLQ